jgi:DNA-directed RNA polymerase subunit RPC12/RpoP
MSLTAAPTEVRQCAACQQPALVVVMEWQHTTGGISTGSVTREYRCQNCGTWAVRRPRPTVIAYWILGVLFAPACGLGLPWLYLAWRDSQFDKRLPLVAGAATPAMRFPGGPPKRTCGKCGGIARAVNITRHTHRGVPTGTDYDYQCGQCGLKFTTENVLGHVTSSLGFFALLGVSMAFFVGAQSAGWKWGGSIVSGLLAGFLGWQNIERVLNRSKHRALEEGVR